MLWIQSVSPRAIFWNARCCLLWFTQYNEAAAHSGRRQPGFQGRIRSDAAVVGRKGRARGGGEAATREGGRQPGLQGRIRSDAAVVGRREWTRSGGEAATREGGRQ